MSDMYDVTVTERTAGQIIFRATIVHPDAMPIRAKERLALMFIHKALETSNDASEAALHKILSWEDLEDGDTTRFVTQVEVRDVINDADNQSVYSSRGDLKARPPAATLVARVVDAALLGGLSRGHKFDSTAFY